MHKKKNTHQTFYHKSRYRGNRYFPISDGPTYRYHDRLPYCQNAFSQASRQRCLEIYTKPVVRKNQESLFETFSKRSPPPSKNLSSLQKYIPNGSFDISTKPNRSRSFSYSSRFSLFSPDSTGGGNIYDRNTEVKDRTRSKISHASVIDDDSKQKMGQIRRDVAWFLPRKKVRNNI